MADQYAFIPREAISKFLSYCTECQKKQPSHQGQPGPEVRQCEAAHEVSHEAMEISHVPATPPATPPSQQDNREKSPGRCEEELSQQAAVHAMAYAQACHAMQTFMSRTLPGQVGGYLGYSILTSIL